MLRNASQLAATMPGQQFITCVYAVHDPVEATLTYANAGHPAPAVLDPDGTVRFERERLGMPLRVGDAFDQRVVPFPAGSALLLYTDGLVERRGRPLPTGIDELDAALRARVAPATDAAAACDALIQQLTAGSHDDDVALLYARDRFDADNPRRIAVLPLAAEAVASSRARRFAATTLAGWGLTGPFDRVAIVVSELVSNAVRHTGAPAILRLHQVDDRLVIEVVDRDERPPHPVRPAIQDENHRGLYIVEALSLRWGSRPGVVGETGTTGKVVWAELALTA